MTRPYEPQPVPQISVPSATSGGIIWDLTVADYKEWRAAFYAPLDPNYAQEQLQNEVNLLKAILQSSGLAWRVVWTYLDLIECRPKEKVNPFKEPRKAS